MPYPRVKSESYQNFGGINQKSSPADLSILEFLDISNMDFTSMGALQQRQGTTTFLTGPALNATQNIQTFGSTLINSFSGGATNFNVFFSTLTIQTGATFIGGNISSVFEFANLQGASFIMFSAPGGFAYGASAGIAAFTLNQMYFSTGTTFGYLFDPLGKVIGSTDFPSNPNWSFVDFVDRVFLANGDHFFKWDGYTATITYQADKASFVPTNYRQVVPSVYKYCLPPPGGTIFSNVAYLNGVTAASYSGFNSATYTYSYGFINDRGFMGPVTDPVTISFSLGFQDSSHMIIIPPLVNLFGFSSGYQSGLGITVPYSGFSLYDGFGIGARSLVDYTGITNTSNPTFGTPSTVAIFRDNGPGTGRFFIGFAYNLNYTITVGTSTFQIDRETFAESFTDGGLPTSNIPEPTCIFATLAPQFLEVYNNQLFACGFSQAPSVVQFSDIGEPESIQPENNFEVRTNDSDYLTGLEAAFGELFFFKNNSFHRLVGTDPTNFALSPISTEYGCISNRAIASYQSFMMFLDKKGIVLFNGSIPVIASSKIDPLFAQMNLSAAKNNAWMLHNKQRNQVWCGIPVNGSTMINQIIVFDYLLNAWTHFDAVNAECATPAYGSQPLQTVYFGGYSSQLAYFGSSLTGDVFTPGHSITMYWQSRFVADEGQSVEKIWRRLFLNTLSSQGATNIWSVALYANFASLPSATFLLGGQSFQCRADFGISSKNLSVRGTFSTSSDTLSFTGFTVESRYQRNE